METGRGWIGAALVGTAFVAGIGLALALRPSRPEPPGAAAPTVAPPAVVALPLALPVPPPQVDAAEVDRPRGEIASAPVAEPVAPTPAPLPAVVRAAPAPVVTPSPAAAPVVVEAVPTPAARPQPAAAPRPPAGAPTVRVSFLAWSRTPERRSAALTIAGGGLTTVHEGEHADGIEVVEILPDGVRYRLEDSERVFTARARD